MTGTAVPKKRESRIAPLEEQVERTRHRSGYDTATLLEALAT